MKTELMCICAWCRVVVRVGNLPITHGICIKCGEQIKQEIEAMEGDNVRANSV